MKHRGSPLEEALALQLQAANIEGWVREFRFLKKRRFRFDFAWPDLKVAIEIQGGIHLGHRGGHSSAEGLARDMLKFNYAQIAGWRVLLFTGKDVKTGWAMSWIVEMLKRAREGQALRR